MLVLSVVLLCVFTASCQGAAASFAGLTIVPILWHGPNNQITTIKEALSLASFLPDARVALPDLEEHRFSDHAAHHMAIGELFDLELLRASNASFIQLHELRKTWDGQLDLLLYFRDDAFPSVRRLVDKHMGLQAPEKDRWVRSPISVERGCSADKVEELRAMLRSHRYVGMLCYDDFAVETHKLAGTLLSDCGEDLCCEAYKQKSPLLRKSPHIYELAGNFIRDKIGMHNRFIAAHIRPMPDPCVELWKQPQEDLDPKQLEDICRTDFMYYRFVPNLRALQRKHNISTVFIMTHPVIRPRVFRMLKAGGINPVYMDMAELNASMHQQQQQPRPGAHSNTGRTSSSAATRTPGLRGGGGGGGGGGAGGPRGFSTPLSVSLLAVVEEAVSTAATVFLGTAESSMTGMIVQERLARGAPPASTYFMSGSPECADSPCTLPSYYTGASYQDRRRKYQVSPPPPQQQQQLEEEEEEEFGSKSEQEQEQEYVAEQKQKQKEQHKDQGPEQEREGQEHPVAGSDEGRGEGAEEDVEEEQEEEEAGASEEDESQGGRKRGKTRRRNEDDGNRGGVNGESEEDEDEEASREDERDAGGRDSSLRGRKRQRAERAGEREENATAELEGAEPADAKSDRRRTDRRLTLAERVQPRRGLGTRGVTFVRL